MKYCLSSRQNRKYLDYADEIFVESRDYRQISDLFIDYPEKMIILEISNENIVDENYMKLVEQYSELSKNFCCCIYNLHEAHWFKTRQIKFYYGYPINSFYDIKDLMKLGVEYIKITAPLTFENKILQRYDMKFRMVPNVAYDAYIPRENGIYGQWVRPEDVKYYKGVYIFEFEDANLDKERTLYDIYNRGIWNGNINLLITNLNMHADNRILPDDIGEIRSNCGQRCMRNGTCHYCETAFGFEKAIRKYKRDKENQELLNAPQDDI